MADQTQPTKSKIVEGEEKTLAFWTKESIFEKTIEARKKGKEFVFYDGPPFATGLPHYGHILASTIKDTVARYKTMRGFHVPRKWGWDCHGLPVENIVEKELNLESRKDIETFGIEKFNNIARDIVMRYADDWKRLIPRFGRFVDMENDYKTMDRSYTESVWWAFKTLHEKGLVYEGFKPMHLCPRCETTLSNFEVNQGYKDITDISVFVRFELIDEPKTYVLAWTTTPWTLPGNVALAVGADIDYVKVKIDTEKKSQDGALVKGEEFLILAKQRLESTLEGRNFEIVEEFKGSALVGKSYKPVYGYYANDAKVLHRENGWKIYDALFVTTEDGTGVVHIAPAFGEDDMALGKEKGLPFVQHVSTDGKFKKEVHDFAHLDVKPKGDHQRTDVEVIKNLAHRGFLFDKKKITHSYPHCWRCDTPLLNYAASSWFVKVTDIKQKLVDANKTVSWVPENIRDGRFGKWLEGARDWAISRSRFWGAPLPVWRSEDGEVFIPGSLDELLTRVHAKNRYIIMRHGEAENNVQGIYSSLVANNHHLTEKGRDQVRDSAAKLKSEKIDIIIASPMVRTQETADIVRLALDVPKKHFRTDDRLIEAQVGVWNKKPIQTAEGYFKNDTEFLNKSFPQGESRGHIGTRMLEALENYEKEYSGKTILIVTHGTPAWTLYALAGGQTLEEGLKTVGRDENFLANAQFRDVVFKPVSRNKQGEIDLHRPYIDQVAVYSSKGKRMSRVPEVFDCWFESGSMPYGKAGFVGKATSEFSGGGFLKKSVGFPADFIGEGIDQTRGWFYTMMVLGVALFGKSPYKNVVVNGIVLAENGEKMSKRLKNYPDPMDVVNKYGADALRYYLLSSPVVSGEDLKFSEKGVDEVSKKFIQRLDNVLSFYGLYQGEIKSGFARSKNPLDVWILTRLDEVVFEVVARMDRYELDKAVRPILDFIDDLSNWHVRRSRDRVKGDDVRDKQCALNTIRTVLFEVSKLIAPFMPFYAETLYKSVGGEKESVHLENFPEAHALSTGEKEFVARMAEIRAFASTALQERAKANIKVRQPLAKLTIRSEKLLNETKLLTILAEEVNVKKVEADSKLTAEIVLDTVITPELKAEGDIREFIRALQDLRKKLGFVVGEEATLTIDAPESLHSFVNDARDEARQVAQVVTISFANIITGEEVKIEKGAMKVLLERVSKK